MQRSIREAASTQRSMRCEHEGPVCCAIQLELVTRALGSCGALVLYALKFNLGNLMIRKGGGA